jgi:hypothetical protein
MSDRPARPSAEERASHARAERWLADLLRRGERATGPPGGPEATPQTRARQPAALRRSTMTRNQEGGES